MRIARITCQAEIEVPESAVQIQDFLKERVLGYKLSDGTKLKPWITWELVSKTKGSEEETFTDVDEEELAEMGFENFEHGKTDIAESHISNPHEDDDYER